MSLSDITPYPSPTAPDQMTLPEKQVLETCSILLRRCIQRMTEYESDAAERYRLKLVLAEETINRRYGGFCPIPAVHDQLSRLIAYPYPEPGCDSGWDAVRTIQAVRLLLEAAA